MSYIKSIDSTGKDVNIYYEDQGSGIPVVLIHGWPLDHQMWEYQVTALAAAGFRCISYDRRGFGKSDKPWEGYDYNTLADDLKALMDQLELQDAVLVGFSMGGGEIVKYFSRHGGKGVSKVALIGSIVPFMLKTDDNEDGVPQEVFDGMVEKINEDRAAFLGDFSKQFYGVGMLSHPISEQAMTYDLTVAMQASLKATLDCANSFSSTDLRKETPSINVPTLIIHGDKDATVPIKTSSDHAAKLISGYQYIVYEGEPHGLFFTSKDRLNQHLIEFLRS